jgi:hypothetical protein
MSETVSHSSHDREKNSKLSSLSQSLIRPAHYICRPKANIRGMPFYSVCPIYMMMKSRAIIGPLNYYAVASGQCNQGEYNVW